MRAKTYAGEGDRAERRDFAGVAVGATSGAIGGVLLGWSVLGDASLGLLMTGLLGALAGALFGKFITAQISPDDWDPGPSDLARPYVGIHAPDHDAAAGPTPTTARRTP